jgi:hypothetical protein
MYVWIAIYVVLLLPPTLIPLSGVGTTCFYVVIKIRQLFLRPAAYMTSTLLEILVTHPKTGHWDRCLASAIARRAHWPLDHRAPLLSSYLCGYHFLFYQYTSSIEFFDPFIKIISIAIWQLSNIWKRISYQAFYLKKTYNMAHFFEKELLVKLFILQIYNMSHFQGWMKIISLCRWLDNFSGNSLQLMNNLQSICSNWQLRLDV